MLFTLFLINLLILEIFIMSLNSRLKAVEEKIADLNAVTKDDVTKIINDAVKPLQERAEEIATYDGVDEDKTPPQPTPPAQAQ